MSPRRTNVNSKFYMLEDQFVDTQHKGVDVDTVASLNNSDDSDNHQRESFVTSDGENIIDFKQIRQYLLTFKPYGLQPIVDLPLHLTTMFKSFNFFMINVQKNDSIYEKVRTLIKEIFPYEDTIIIPGTINAYFIGCQCSLLGDERGCDPECVNNLPAMVDGKVLTSACADYVLVYTDSQLLSLHEGSKTSSVAWVYVPVTFTFFDASSYKQLQDYDISIVNLLRANAEGKYTLVEDKVALTSLAPPEVTADKSITITPPVVPSTRSNYMLGWILLIVLLVIIFGIIVWIFYRATSHRVNTSFMPYSTTPNGTFRYMTY